MLETKFYIKALWIMFFQSTTIIYGITTIVVNVI